MPPAYYELSRFTWELPVAVVSARGTWKQREGLLFCVFDEAGRVGVGEASPLPGYSRESLDEVEADLRAGPELARLPASRFAYETAMADLEAEVRGVTLTQVLGGDDARVLTESALVASVHEARVAVARGRRTLKLKIGVPGAWERELALVAAIRHAVGADVALRLDANGGFPPDEVMARLAALVPYAPEFVEEPVTGTALAALRGSPVPLAADESLQDPALWPALAESCRVLVLKPTALGGLKRCLELGREAAERDLALVVTHTFDAAVARAAGMALARSLPGRVLACALELPEDPARKPLSILAADDDAPERPALVAEGVTLTYEELAARAQAVVLPEAPFVPLVADNRIDTVATILAAFERDVPALLVHPRLTAPERDALLTSAAGKTPAPGTAAILFTSGTTGAPRGAMLSHDALLASAAASAAQLGIGEDDRWLACMPLAHVGGLSILTRCLLARATVVLEPRFDAAHLPAQIVAHGVTLLSLVPTMLARLLDEHPDWTPPAHLRAILLGGAGTPARLLERARTRGLPVLTTYGLTEACSQVVTAGRVLPGVELRVVGEDGGVAGADGGRVQVRGATLMSGYLGEPLRDPEAWLDTGDLGELDASGQLRIHARRTDLIVTGGENVYPAEVEDALAGLPGIEAACVFGVPDETWGQIVAALVVGDPGVDRAALAAAVDARLAPHKRPRRLAFVEALPVNRAGKLDRAAAAREYQGRLAPF